MAVKRLYGQQEVQTQFIKEANSMCSLDHPSIIRLYGIVLSEPLMLVRCHCDVLTCILNCAACFVVGIRNLRSYGISLYLPAP